MTIEKMDTNLARLLGAAVGWVTSDDTVRSGGGSPRGEMSTSGQDHWSDAMRRKEIAEQRREERRSASEQRRHDRSMRRTRKSFDAYPEFEDLQMFFVKDHAPIPPRQGLVWDAVKHRWTRPENAGHTVTEVQGNKRIRGTGTGVHERRVGGHGSGPTRYQQLGRRFRGVADSGRTKPHETAHPSQRGFGRKGAVNRGRPKKR